MTTTTDQPISPIPVKVPPRRESGYAAGGNEITSFWSSLADERTPDLRWPIFYDVYDDMMNSPQVYAVLRSVMMPILAAAARLDGSGCDDDAIELCSADLGLPVIGEGESTPSEDDPVEDDKFSYKEHLEVALEEGLGYGHSYYEQKAYLGDDGRWHLAKLGWRPPRSIVKYNVADDGGLVSIEQRPPTSGNGIVTASSTKNRLMKVDRLVAYVHRRKGGNWIGRSLLRPAYEPYLINSRAKRLEMTTVERFATPTPVFTDNDKGTDKTLVAGEQVARDIRSGQAAGAGLASGQTLELLVPQGTPIDVGKIKTYNDELIGRVVLAHFLNLGSQGQGHSYALGVTLEDFFTLGVQSTAGWVANIGTRHIVRDLVTWNWGPTKRAPKIVFDEIGSKQEAIVMAIASLVAAGVLKPDEDLEKFVRVALGLPPRGGAPILPSPKETP